MARGANNTRVGGRTQFVTSRRSISPSIRASLPVRERLGFQQRQSVAGREQFVKSETALANKIISDINAGRIRNINQIPVRFRSVIGVSQSQLNTITNYYAAKKDADLWDTAYRHAEAAIKRNNPLIVTFSSSPYTKTVYKGLREQYAAYQQRKKQIQDIRSGKTTGIEIRGGRIWNTSTGRPITPQAATNRQFYTTLQKELGGGERLLVDRNFNITGIKSSALNQTIKLDKQGIAFYNNQMSRSVGLRRQKTMPVDSTERRRGNLTVPSNIVLTREVKDMVNNLGYSPQINNITSTRQLNTIIQNDVKMKTPSAILSSIADIISGGYITEKKINQDQVALNNRIISFNSKYNGAELSQSQFDKAQSEFDFIEAQQRKLNSRFDKLVASKKNKVRNFYSSFSLNANKRLTVAEQREVATAIKLNVKTQRQIKTNQPKINQKNNLINTKQREITKLQSKQNRNLLEDIKLIRLKNQVNTLRTDIARLQFEMPPKILMGTMPIIPAASISSAITQVRFVGVQKIGKGGKIVTDIVFNTNRGFMGASRGVSVLVKGKTVSIVGGRFGKVTARLLKGGRKITKLRSFVGVEKSIVKQATLTSQQLRQIVRFTQAKKKAGLIRIIKNNIKVTLQAGLGRVATIKGRKFVRPFIRFPSGRIGARLGKGIDLDDFASISAILTKKDISAIIGKTITLKGRKSEFIGIIKSLKSSSSKVVLSSLNKQQYSRAMQKLFSTVAAAVSKTERAGQFKTRAMVLSAAAASISKTVPTISGMAAAKTTLVPKKVTFAKVASVDAGVKIKTISPQQKISAGVQKKRLVVKQAQLVNQISKQQTKIAQLSNNRSRAAQRQVSSLRAAQRLAQKQLARMQAQQRMLNAKLGIGRGAATIVPLKLARGFSLSIPSGFKKKTLRKAQPTYYVVIRKKGKIVRLKASPLIMKDARDYGSYTVDHNLSRSFWFEPLGKSKDVVGLPKRMIGYFGKHSKKFRAFKIKRGVGKKIRNGYIEKTKYIQDRKLEKQQLSSARRKKRVKRRVVKRKRKVVKRRKPVRRKRIKRKPVRRKKRVKRKRVRIKRKVIKRRKPVRRKRKRK